MFATVAVIIVFLDQLTKWLVEMYKPIWSVSVFTLHYATNTGAGFSILQGRAFVLGFISLIAAGLILWQYDTFPAKRWVQICLGLVLGGIVGNMLDRFFREYVIDFLDFSFWPSFNVADAAISVGMIGLVVWYWREERVEKMVK